MSRVASQRARVARLDESTLAAAAEVIQIDGDALFVRRRRDGVELRARLAFILGYVPALRDEVLVVESDVGPLVIAVLRASSPVVLSGEGDVVLRAPSGSVRVEAAADVAISAERDATLAGARRSSLRLARHGGEEEASPSDLESRVSVEQKGVTVAGPTVEARAKRTRLVSAGADVVAQAIRTSATTIETRARKIDITAEQAVRRAKEVLEEISGLVETRAGRVRSLVRGAFSLRSRTTAMRSSEDTSVDGRRVLLG